MKATIAQKEICNTLIRTICWWRDSNDITSPTHLNDIEDCQRADLESIVSDDDLEFINKQMEKLYWTVRKYAEAKTAVKREGIFAKRLVDCNLTVRTLNCLKAADIETVGDLVQMQLTDLLKIRNMGRRSIIELRELVEGNGLEWGMKLEP